MFCKLDETAEKKVADAGRLFPTIFVYLPPVPAAKKQMITRRIDLSFHIRTDLFSLELISGEVRQFMLRTEPSGVILVCPSGFDFAAPGHQEWLHKVVREVLRRQAKQLLPARLKTLSNRHDLPYGTVKINTAHTRWGSCSSKGNINLSCYLLLLPSHLIDYVLLHELAHTRQMNHGAQFHALLGRLTNQRESALREELRNYSRC